MYIDPGGRRGGTARCDLRTAMPPILNTTPQGNLESEGEVAATEDPNLEEPPELGQEVTCFLRGLAENSKEVDEKAPSP